MLKLKDKDTIEWVYTCDLGRDVGDDYYEKIKNQKNKKNGNKTDSEKQDTEKESAGEGDAK